jgi:hypothetical protein
MAKMIFRAAFVGTVVSGALVSAIYLLISIIAMLTWQNGDPTSESFPFRLMFALLWFGYLIVIGLASLIVSVPAWLLLFASRYDGAIAAIVLGAGVTFLFVILMKLALASFSLAHEPAWWKGTIIAAIIQAIVGSITGWYVSINISPLRRGELEQ